jgi:hypothetical protein
MELDRKAVSLKYLRTLEIYQDKGQFQKDSRSRRGPVGVYYCFSDHFNRCVLPISEELQVSVSHFPAGGLCDLEQETSWAWVAIFFLKEQGSPITVISRADLFRAKNRFSGLARR